MNDRAGHRAYGSANADELWKQARRVQADLLDLRDALGETVNIGETLLRSRLRTQPYTTLVTAAALGYVLGGGLPRIALTNLLGVGGRMASGILLTRLVGTLSRLSNDR